MSKRNNFNNMDLPIKKKRKFIKNIIKTNKEINNILNEKNKIIYPKEICRIGYVYNDLIKTRNYSNIHSLLICPYSDLWINNKYDNTLEKKTIKNIEKKKKINYFELNIDKYNKITIKDRITRDFINDQEIQKEFIKNNICKIINYNDTLLKLINYLQNNSNLNNCFFINLKQFNIYTEIDSWLYILFSQKQEKKKKIESIRVNILFSFKDWIKLNNKNKKLYNNILNIIVKKISKNIKIDSTLEHVCNIYNILFKFI